MGRAKRLGGETGGTGLAVEYVRTRKVLRVLGWFADAPIEPVEIPVDQLWRVLAIEPRDLGVPVRYLLFAGSHHGTAGGLRDLVGTYEVEEEAWTAFRDLRQVHPSTQGWAELATIDPAGHINQLAWFGLHRACDTRPGVPPSSRGVPPPAVTARPTRADDHPAYLRAVTPS